MRIHINGHDHEVHTGIKPHELLAHHVKDSGKPVAALFNGKPVDLSRELHEEGTLQFLTFDDAQGKQVFWHSTSHILAQAIKRLYPEAKPTLGPPIDEGFYYDFDNLAITEEDLKKIEKEMQRVVGQNFPCVRKEYKNKEEAKADYQGNEYKQEIIDQSTEHLSAYSQGDYLDLCRGPHVPSTNFPQAIKLIKLAGAYWRGDSKNKMLTRIYGISFPNAQLLKQWEELRAEAERRDHRKIGRELDLFGFEEVSPGSPFFYAKGAIIYNELLTFIRQEYVKRGYQEVITPLLYEKSLWEQSGHWSHYQENMFIINEDNTQYVPKPMNCPSHCLVYNHLQHSYRELPIRIADFAPLHRNELRGALGGLTRVRKFSQDDAHIFLRHDQIKEEIAKVIDFARYIYNDVMHMPFSEVLLSTRPESFLGEIETWNAAEQALAEAMTEAGIQYKINPGDGAFYGPKIDFQIKDALGRTWQTATIQLDFQLPQRFGCTYIGEDSQKHPAVMIHRALLGSLERFIGVLTEHYAGRFPLWLAPEQVAVLPINEAQTEDARILQEELAGLGIRAVLEGGNETLNKRVRDCQLRQIPAIIVLGEKEVASNTVAIRTLDGKTQYGVDRAVFAERILRAKQERLQNF
jgi:threonyl-tRNA synthetase